MIRIHHYWEASQCLGHFTPKRQLPWEVPTCQTQPGHTAERALVALYKGGLPAGMDPASVGEIHSVILGGNALLFIF